MTPATKAVVMASPLMPGVCWGFPNARVSIWCDLGPTRAEPARAQSTNCSCEKTACCQEAAAALLAALTWLCTCTNWPLGTSPAPSALKSLSLVYYNKAFFLGELLRNPVFATAVMSSHANWYFHSLVQMSSLSKWWVSPVKCFVLAVLRTDQAAPKIFESFFSVTPALMTDQGKSD